MLRKMTFENVVGTAGCTGLCLAGDRLYAIGQGTLVIYDVSSPLSPRAMGRLEGLGGGRQLAVSGGLLFATARECGLWVIDVSDPWSPRCIRRYDTVELATGVAVRGNRVYVAQRLYGVETLELREGGELVHRGLFRTDEAQSVAAFEGGCVVGDWASGKITLLAERRDGGLRRLGHGRLDGYGDGVAMVGNLVYAATGHHCQSIRSEERLGRGHGLELFDVSDKRHPVKVSTLKFPVWPETLNDYWTVRSDGRYAYCADTHNGFHVVDVSEPRSPRLVKSWRLPEFGFGRRASDGQKRRLPDCVSSVAMGREAVYVAGVKSGLWVLSGVSNQLVSDVDSGKGRVFKDVRKTVPGYVRLLEGLNVRQAVVDGERILAACSHGGLVAVERCGDGWTAGRQLVSGCVYDAVRKGDRLYVARDMYWLDVFKVKSSGELELLVSRCDRSLPIYHIHISQDDRFAMVTGGTGRAVVLDIRDLERISPVFTYGPGQIQYGDYFPEHDLNGFIPDNWHHNGIAWYDLRGEVPVVHKHVLREKLADQIDGIGTFRDHFLAAGWGHGYLLGDERGWVRHHVPGHEPHGIPSWDGGVRVMFSCRRNGTVQCYDFTDPEHAVFVPSQSFKIEGTPGRIRFLDSGKAVVPAGHDGLLVEL